MALNFDPQLGAPTSTLGTFATQLTARANALFEQHAKTAGEVEAQKQILPLKEESELRLEREKGKIARENASSLMQGYLGGGKGLPPGTTLNTATGGMNIPLNREITADESQIVNKVPAIRAEVEKGKSLIKRTGFWTQAMSQVPGIGLAAQGTGSQGLARGEALRQVPNNLKVLLGFTLGGKTFSPTEQKAVMGLIDPRGKSDPQATEDLEKAAKLAEYASELVQNGQAAAKSWKEVMGEVGISVSDFEARLGLGDEESPDSPNAGLPPDTKARAIAALQRKRQGR